MTDYQLLKGFFESATLPRAVLLNEYTFIGDVPKFVRSHLDACENMKVETSPYHERLAALMQIIATKDKTAILTGKAAMNPPFRMLNKIDIYEKVNAGRNAGTQNADDQVGRERPEDSEAKEGDKTKRKGNGLPAQGSGVGTLFD